MLLVMTVGVGMEGYFHLNKEAERVIKGNTLLWQEIKEYDKKKDREAKREEMSEGVFRVKLLLEVKRIADAVNAPPSPDSPPQDN